MIRRHEDALMSHLEQVVDNGFTIINWVQLYRWYGMQRLGKSVWRDLRDRFSELVGDDNTNYLLCKETGSGLLLVGSLQLTPLSEKVEG